MGKVKTDIVLYIQEGKELISFWLYRFASKGRGIINIMDKRSKSRKLNKTRNKVAMLKTNKDE